MSRSGMLWMILLICLFSGVTAQLQIYQARITTNPSSTEIWKVEGVATVEIGGLRPPIYVFDCNTTLNNGSGVRWSRLDGSHLNGLVVRPLINGERLDASGLSYMYLGNYSCWDATTNEQLILRITDSNPAVVAVNNTVGVTQGGSITLEVYVSGYPTVRSTDIHWYRLNPTRQEITSGATFQDSRRRMILRNVEASATGPYECEAQIPLFVGRILRASARIQLQVYVPPSVRQLQSNIDVIEWTTPFSISCSATGSPLPTIRWERAGGAPLPVNAVPSVMTGNDSVTSTLTFTRQGIRYADRGGYRCVASNQHTTPATSDYTQLTVRPTLLLDVDINGQAQQNFGKTLFAPEGSRIKVECLASGNHYWQTSNGSRISTNSQDTLYQLTDPNRSARVLHITSFSQDTVDMYMCVTNITGTLVQRGLFITSCATPPTNLTAEPVDPTSIKVSWTQPTSGATVTGFRIYYRILNSVIDHGSVDVGANETQQTLFDLERGFAYTISLVTKSQQFPSTVTASIKATLAMVSKVMVRAANATALFVSWDALQDSYLSHYTIYYSAFSPPLGKVVDRFTKVIPSTKTSDIVNIRELRAGVEHEFQVTASLEIEGEVYEGVKSVPAKMVIDEAVFQLQMGPVTSCATWSTSKAEIIESYIHTGVAKAISDRCDCEFQAKFIRSGIFHCWNAPDEVTYRSVIVGTGHHNATKLLRFVQEWVNSEPVLQVEKFGLWLSTKCPVKISSLSAPQCPSFRQSSAGGAQCGNVCTCTVRSEHPQTSTAVPKDEGSAYN